MVMPSDRTKMTRQLNENHVGRLGNLFSPVCFKNPQGLPYALDNGRFPAWSSGKIWDEKSYWKLIEKAKKVNHSPLWILIPDVVADAEATFAEWEIWYPKLIKLGWPLALAVQDGMTVSQVKNLTSKPDVIFIGGTTKWKWRTLASWCQNFPRVHVGRVNTERMLWSVHRHGAESSDGTGWWHHKQRKQLERYLERSDKGLNRYDHEELLI